MATKRFLGLQYPLVKSPRGILAQKSGVDQVKADLLQLLLTNPGERCLTGDTIIPLANGTESTILDLVGKQPFWVYSFDVELNKVVPGLATARKTLEDATLVKVTLDNEEFVRCTPDHLWMLRDGTYRRADGLLPGDSLMPLYRNKNTSGYERVYQPSIGDYRETHLCFVEGTRLTGEREVVHHKDLNKLNNAPDNLQWMTCNDHKELHKYIRSKFQDKLDNDPEFYETWRQSLINGLNKYYETHDGSRKGAILSKETKKKLSDNKVQFYQSVEGDQAKERLRQNALNQFETQGHPSLGRKHSEVAKEKMRKPRPSVAGENNPSKRPEVIAKIKETWAKKAQKNHKVISVERLDKKEDCYDLHVEKYHNFAVSVGAFVHNCMLPEYGIPLRTLFFEPNDPMLEDKARQMIADAIQLWEPRIKIQDIIVNSRMPRSSLNPIDPGYEIDSILSVVINFYDPQNISEVNELVLEISPLGGV